MNYQNLTKNELILTIRRKDRMIDLMDQTIRQWVAKNREGTKSWARMKLHAVIVFAAAAMVLLINQII